MTTNLSVAIKYGAHSDLDENAGRAHFLEHMIPGGSSKRINISRKAEYLGGVINFFTYPEFTCGIVSVTPDKISEASHLMSEILFDQGFEQEKFETERQIIKNEIRRLDDDDSEIVNQMLRNCLFKSHPVRREIAGSRKSISELSIKKIVEAQSSYYTLSNMILVLTGKFSEKDVDLVLNDFSFEAKNEKVPTKQFSMEKSKTKRKITRSKPGLSQTNLSIGARTVPSRHPDAPVMDLITTMLGTGFSSRLFIEVREKQGLTYDIPASH